jgi:hypothetical protein
VCEQQIHCTENARQIVPEMKLRILVPNFYIHVSVNDLHIPTICMLILLQQNKWTNHRNMSINL